MGNLWLIGSIGGVPSRAFEYISQDNLWSNGAKVMQLNNYGIEVGCDANLVIHQANNPIEAIRLCNARLFVIRNGQVIAKANPIESELFLNTKKVSSVIDWTL